MNPATATFASTAAIAMALQAQLRQVQLPNAGGAAFQRVELFEMVDIMDAFRRLLISEQQIAIIVAHDATWHRECQQRKLLIRRAQAFSILISDRVIGARTSALYGGSSNEGAFNLSFLVHPYVTGQLLNNPGGVVCCPAREGAIGFKDPEKNNLPGRAVVNLEVDCDGGWIETYLNVGITL